MFRNLILLSRRSVDGLDSMPKYKAFIIVVQLHLVPAVSEIVQQLAGQSYRIVECGFNKCLRMPH